ncbi:unnamed protein product [Brachionus calyciflorus]|uniref:Uncharacterized protein n=1 Tax=Brachionus calyciflorus TaxID=104777 RepID=A0A813YQE8_9BILA|nr:unnamed protein product [Brachionus calyciflorus]
MFLSINFPDYSNRGLFFILLQFFTKCNNKLKEKSPSILTSDCECKRNEFVELYQKLNGNYLVRFKQATYELDPNKHVFTCDLYNTLKRGPNQKVISYSLYGKDERYYKLIYDTAKKIEKIYPDHLIRIYHDESLDKSFMCDLECSQRHVDFCNIKKLPLDTFNKSNYLNVDFINSRMWRFLAVGDTFIDLVHNRDSDSTILQREKDSVDEWLKSDNIIHIMRDHPQHGTYILAGMWGFKTNLDRNLANLMYEQLVNKTIGKRYNPDGKSLTKHSDQSFLSEFLYPKIRKKATIHDSYTCLRYKDSKPFPTRRLGQCHVGAVGNCNEEKESTLKCPVECRPPNHLDWETC